MNEWPQINTQVLLGSVLIPNFEIKNTTRIMKSKGQRPFSSIRAVRVFWNFLSKIEYWVTLKTLFKKQPDKSLDP